MPPFRLCRPKKDCETRDRTASSEKPRALQRRAFRRALEAAFLPFALALLLLLREAATVSFANWINRRVFRTETPSTSAVSLGVGNGVFMTARAMHQHSRYEDNILSKFDADMQIPN